VKALVRRWLESAPWSSVVAINAALCRAGKATHKPTSDGYERTKLFWEENRVKELSLQELLQICFKCHRSAPFCFYNGNTFVTVVKTLLADTLSQMSADRAYILRSVAGHIVAGTATDIETKQLKKVLEDLEK
jgi:hypothetical protein